MPSTTVGSQAKPSYAAAQTDTSPVSVDSLAAAHLLHPLPQLTAKLMLINYNPLPQYTAKLLHISYITLPQLTAKLMLIKYNPLLQ